MYYNIIKFPFSSVNDVQYTLALCLNDTNDFTGLNNLLREDRELFKKLPNGEYDGDTVYNWQGTLTGSVAAVDDEREDMWTPLVCSKLMFNMACKDFPTWLMSYCNNNRAKVIVYQDEGEPIELWRGYLVAQTLNMTVVNYLLSCPLVAVDEVAMAKYMNFKETVEFVKPVHHTTITGLMKIYHSLHHIGGLTTDSTPFGVFYDILGLEHNGTLLWQRDLCVVDSGGVQVNNLPSLLNVNIDRWLQNKDETWETVLLELFDYLGVTFAVGSYGVSYGESMVADAYLLTCPTDSPTVEQFVFDLQDGSSTSTNSDQFDTLTNPMKLGGNLQITAEPDNYKEVVVTSKPERWKSHEYLTDEHYKPIDESKAVRYDWGEYEEADKLKSYGFHKLVYIKPDDDEDEFLEIPPCHNGEGYVMAQNGILPYDNINSCDNKTEPDAAVAGSLDFITFKEGCCVVKVGSGEIGGIDEDSVLTPYFLILNHMWGNMYMPTLPAYYNMTNKHIADTEWLKFKPLGEKQPIHPAGKHYLQIKFNLMFVRENMPDLTSGHNLYIPAANPQSSPTLIDWRTPAIIMPQDVSIADFGISSYYNASLNLWYELKFEAYIRIGNFYYNGQGWEYVGTGESAPQCDVTLWSNTNEIKWVTALGQYVIGTANYYFTVSNPYRLSNTIDRYTNGTKLLADLDGVSIHGQELEGQLEMVILGQINIISGENSIPFALLNDIEINYTDEAEMVDKDIEIKQKTVMDANSHTKKTYEKSLKMASPQVDGFFENALVYDNGKFWQNLNQVRYQGMGLSFPVEWQHMQRLSMQYGSSQLYVELETPADAFSNVRNVSFRVQGLTETAGYFLPIKRTFDFTKETMRVKLMRMNVVSPV
jgi:hypothetical protein